MKMKMFRGKPEKSLYQLHLEGAMKDILMDAIDEARGNLSLAARNLGIDPSNLRRKLRRLKVDGYPSVKFRKACHAGEWQGE